MRDQLVPKRRSSRRAFQRLPPTRVPSIVATPHIEMMSTRKAEDPHVPPQRIQRFLKQHHGSEFLRWLRLARITHRNL
eukprot:Nitzschia sp. Nitz4//scaffold2_size372955//153387//153617//NITZ4_000409-RA/size372955-est2genome-gene-0.616-mRNA-1//-1//CDS//3329546736//2582//frame0